MHCLQAAPVLAQWPHISARTRRYTTWIVFHLTDCSHSAFQLFVCSIPEIFSAIHSHSNNKLQIQPHIQRLTEVSLDNWWRSQLNQTKHALTKIFRLSFFFASKSRYCGHGVDLRVVSYLSTSLFFPDRMGSVGRKWARRKMSKLSLRKDGICVGGWMIVITKYTCWREARLCRKSWLFTMIYWLILKSAKAFLFAFGFSRLLSVELRRGCYRTAIAAATILDSQIWPLTLIARQVDW